MGSKSNLQVTSSETVTIRRELSNAENIPNSFLDNVRPIFIILRISGRFPYEISGSEIRPFSKTSPIAIYSILLFILYLYLVSVVLNVLTPKLATSESYKDSLKALMAISFLAHYTSIPFTDWMLAPTIIKYINLWHRYECQFNEEFASFPSKHLIQFLSYSSLPIAIYIAHYSVYELCDNSFLLSMIYFPIAYVLSQYGLLWLLCQSYLVRQIRKLKEIVILEGLENRVERTRKGWLLLSELTTATGHSFGMVMTGIGMTSFLALIIYSYLLFTALLDPEGSVEWQLGVIVFFNGLIFFFFFDSAEKTTNEVGRNFYSVIFDQKFSQFDEENFNQLVLLLTTFGLHPPVVKFAGFAVANRQLYVSFFRNTLTYLIVLVQFKT